MRHGMRHLFAVLLVGSSVSTGSVVSSASDGVTAPASVSPATHRFASDSFAKGSRSWSAISGVSYDESLGEIYFTQGMVRHYLADDVAIEYGGMVGYADMRRTPSGVLGGPELGMSWHFARSERWSMYLEGLVGAVLQQHPLAVNTLRFNFDLQPGGGATYRLDERTMLQGGFCWHHLSNAQVRGRAHNFGYDGPTLYLGLERAF